MKEVTEKARTLVDDAQLQLIYSINWEKGKDLTDQELILLLSEWCDGEYQADSYSECYFRPYKVVERNPEKEMITVTLMKEVM